MNRFEWGSSHPRARAVDPAVPAELVVFVALFFLLWRRHRLGEGQRQRVSVVGRRLAALLNLDFRFQHQQIATVDVIPRARQIRRHLFVGLYRAGQQPILHLAPHIGPHVGLGAVRGMREAEVHFEYIVES